MNFDLNDGIDIYVIDLFCGAGGVTTGIERARYFDRQFAKVIACINHDPVAIESHAINHPHAIHYVEKIQTQNLDEVGGIVVWLRNSKPHCKIILWASLECTNFSKAKGGLPRDADSRTLADHLFRYIETLSPDGIWIENVEEFMSWGPLDEHGKPISRYAGQDYIRWTNKLQRYGYNFDYRILNAADYGAFTSRKRYFAQFMMPGIPISWPEQTHCKNPQKGLSGSLQPWNPVKRVLDFEDEGQSIFNRKKPLSNKTLERIYAGLIKYVAGGKEAFLTKYYSGRPENKISSVDEPAATVRCKDGQAFVTTAFLANYYSSGGELNSIDGPAATLPTKDRISLIQPKYWLDKYFTGKHNHQGVDRPAGTVLTNDKHAIIRADHTFLMHTNYNNLPTSLDAPMPTITANRKWSYLVNPSWGGHPTGTDQPSPVIVARQDKAPMYMVIASEGVPQYKYCIGRSIIDVKIRYFMAAYGIVDVKMRMLKIPELLRIQGFGDSYKLKGTQADQKKFIGNAVEVNQARVNFESMYEGIVKANLSKIA